MKYWLVKSEGDCYSIDDLAIDTKKRGHTQWSGVRNFQARNFLKEMKKGDLVLFYHSNGTPVEPNGVYGVARVVNESYIDETALDSKDEHFDPRSVAYKKVGKEPLWVAPDLAFVKKLEKPVTLEEIKRSKDLSGILVAKRGQRLSVMPVSEDHFRRITSFLRSTI
jgi:predicted RNA-binding protein with PUA-like domain